MLAETNEPKSIESGTSEEKISEDKMSEEKTSEKKSTDDETKEAENKELELSIFDMPLPVFVEILQNLEMPDVVSLMRTCKAMKHNILYDNILWKRLSRNKVIVLPSIDHAM